MLSQIYTELAEVFDSPLDIDRHAKSALLEAGRVDLPHPNQEGIKLDQCFVDIMTAKDAHPICTLLMDTPFDWSPPQISDDPAYQSLGETKVHVELIGPDGLVPSEDIRVGLYGIKPHTEYGIRTHPAEETFKMLAGEVYWQRGAASYTLHKPGSESYHPSMLPHATKTAEKAFMSIYVWRGDVSKDGYQYQGVK